MLLLPFPYIANTAGWITAELGRQPWLIYGLMRTARGVSPNVSAGNALFTLLGFMGMYAMLGSCSCSWSHREIEHGPGSRSRAKLTERSTMETLWFCLVAVMLAVYVVLDGFDLGAGIVHLSSARTDAERRRCSRSIGPVWDGNEVWLLAGGGTLYFAFPALYASSFSGFYLPLMIVLWLLILRGISIEFRNHVDTPIWGAFWDVVFCGSSPLLAIFFGAALGNVVRGVPLDKAGGLLPAALDATSLPAPTPAFSIGTPCSARSPRSRAHAAWRALGRVQDSRPGTCTRRGARRADVDRRAVLRRSRSAWPASSCSRCWRRASRRVHGSSCFRSSARRLSSSFGAARGYAALPRFLSCFSLACSAARRRASILMCFPRCPRTSRTDHLQRLACRVWARGRTGLVDTGIRPRHCLCRLPLPPLCRAGRSMKF